MGDEDPQAVTELVLDVLPPSSVARPGARRRALGRFLVVGVAMLLVGGVVLIAGDRDGSAPDPDDGGDPSLPQPVALTPLGPRDGKASIGLPVTAEPAVGLEDGSVVTMTGSGFEPQESVAIVQCAIEAGRPARGGQAAGVDGCDTSTVVYVNADGEGVASGSFEVSTIITTPVTGITECSTGPDRCIVAMAAVSDYDRSGGSGLTFGPAPEPDPAVPQLVVDPSTGLADAQVVHVVATGLPASTPIELEVCSLDPSACWSTGRSEEPTVELVTDAEGGLAADVPVWRYLPGPEPRTYVDCAVSACDLVLTTGTPSADPPPARLIFEPGGDGPMGAALSVEPAEEVAPASAVVVRGAGFDPTTTVSLSLCITAGTGDEPDGLCVDLGEPVRPTDDGTFETEVVVPGVDALGGERLAEPSYTTTDAPDQIGSWPCDGISTQCVVRAVLAFGDTSGGPLRPRFGPDPVVITYAGPG